MIIVAFESRKPIVEQGTELDRDIENVRSKVKRINKAFSRMHQFDMEVLIKGGGDHEKTLKHHIKTIKDERKS